LKEKLFDFFLKNCFKIMITGFILSAVGIIFYSQVQRKDPMLGTIAFAITASGIGLYIFGRIFVFIQRRKARKLQDAALKASSPDEKEPT
jgi:hypothetical protein